MLPPYSHPGLLACLCFKETQGEHVPGKVRRSWGRGNFDQNIFYGKKNVINKNKILKKANFLKIIKNYYYALLNVAVENK